MHDDANVNGAVATREKMSSDSLSECGHEPHGADVEVESCCSSGCVPTAELLWLCLCEWTPVPIIYIASPIDRPLRLSMNTGPYIYIDR